MEPPEYWEDEHYVLMPSPLYGEDPFTASMGVHLCKSCGGVAFDRGVHDKWHSDLKRNIKMASLGFAS